VIERKVLEKETRSPIKRKAVFISIIAITLLGLIVYANSINGKFVWDDDFLVKNNVYIKSWTHLPKIFTQDDGVGAGTKYNFYRPLRIVTYMIDYSLWKLDVRGYHFINLVLHIAVALCVYWLITLLYDDWLLSLLASILFVVHPIHTEAIAYISGRTDPLAALFLLLCFIFYIKTPHLKTVKAYTLILFSYILALLSKENALILPALLLLYHYTFREKLRIKEFLSIVSITLIYIALRAAVLTSSLPHSWGFATLLQRVPGFFVAVTNYIRLLLLPFNLHAVYEDRLFNPTDPKAIAGCVILLSLLIYVFKKRGSNKLIFFSVFWFFIALLPVCGIYPIAFYMAEHYIYLPSVGFFLLFAKGLSYIYRTKRLRIFTISFVSGMLVLYSYLTIKQNRYWQEPIVFYKRTLKYAPNNAVMYNNLGKAYSAIAEQEQAIASYNKALEIDPGYARAYNNLANVYSAMNKKEQAIALYNKTIEINPNYAEIYYNLANIYHSVGASQDAILLYNKAIKINPNLTQAYYNLANIYNNMGRGSDAMLLYEEAIRINPDFTNAHINLAFVNDAINRKEEIIAELKKAIEANPNDAAAYNNLSIVYLHNKQYKLAIDCFDKAKGLGLINPILSESLMPHREQ